MAGRVRVSGGSCHIDFKHETVDHKCIYLEPDAESKYVHIRYRYKLSAGGYRTHIIWFKFDHDRERSAEMKWLKERPKTGTEMK